MITSHFIALDFETTGLQPQSGDRITEVGLVRVVDGRITERFESLVDCERRIPHAIVAYTGITQQMVDAAPPASEVMRRVAQFIGDAPVVAHNASFDQSFYLRECSRHDVAMVGAPFICSMRLARSIYPTAIGHSLSHLARQLRLPSTGQPHRALADAEMTAQLMLQMVWDVTLLARIDVTPDMLRDLMHLPGEQVRQHLARLCA
jgi:DNA polymerase-3 subunit epsilon